MKSSRLSGFYKSTLTERQQQLALLQSDIDALARGGLDLKTANRLIENVVGLYALPFGIATNFQINGRDVLIPMVIEEPSVVAGASNAAKIAGAFTASADESRMIGQIQILDLRPSLRSGQALDEAQQKILSARGEILALANSLSKTVRVVDIETRLFRDSRVGAMLVLHLIFDTRDAMGANAINTACETIAPLIENITGGRVNLRILSNLADKRLARASCNVSKEKLGDEVARGIIEAQALAEIDPYRATTHNKGIMNGIDAVALATAQDWRSIEAGAHAYAARDGHYRALTKWNRDANGDLRGEIELPLAVGIVGGTVAAHPVAQIALKILGVTSAQELASVMAAVGLAQNLGALRALASEGIQAGHMELHARKK
ncbi:MAG: hydroxymethylglutaryl-CoA reductase, degradative [Chloroflexi bacterium]|nr:hydroxymethylglutaryl-CoA reductase, degradative [Chloroflexota bacterium]